MLVTINSVSFVVDVVVVVVAAVFYRDDAEGTSAQFQETVTTPPAAWSSRCVHAALKDSEYRGSD